MIRSISYSRYFKIPTVMAAGRAKLAKNEAISRMSRDGLGAEPENPGKPDDGDGSPAHQPFELLPALAAGPPPAEDLPGHERRPRTVARRR